MGFDALLGVDLIVLGVDEGLALLAIDGLLLDFVSSGDAVDGCIAANDR